MKISVVIPVHNEEKYLPYLLANLPSCKVYESIFVLDRCTDQSKALIENIKLPFAKRIIEIEKKHWRSFTAEPIAIGFKNATGDMIFCVGADYYLDPTVFERSFDEVDFCSFKLLDYGLFLSFAKRMRVNIFRITGPIYERLRCFSLRKSYAMGFYGIRREVYSICPHQDRSDEDYLILMSLMRLGFRYKFFRSHSLHLKTTNITGKKRAAERSIVNYHVGLLKIIFWTYRNLDGVFLKQCLETRAKQNKAFP